MANEHTTYKGEIDVPEEAIKIIDTNVVTALPFGTEVRSITPHGGSFWTGTARLDTVHNDISTQYFLKTAAHERGKSMMRGEFEAMSAIYRVTPDFVPHPIAWGTYAANHDVHFYLCTFHEMEDKLPELNAFTKKLAELHRHGNSPDGRFGFQVTTYHGQTPLEHIWSHSWEEYFTVTTRQLLVLEEQVQGPSNELRAMSDDFFGKVVPRLLRPLETGGNKIKPCLLHGDLWNGNASMDANTERPIVFDAASFYGHNEYDLGVWRAPWNTIGKPYVDQYHKHFHPSPPKEDQDDRNALYATRVNILDSILYKNEPDYRARLIEGMRALIEKFPDGFVA